MSLSHDSSAFDLLLNLDPLSFSFIFLSKQYPVQHSISENEVFINEIANEITI